MKMDQKFKDALSRDIEAMLGAWLVFWVTFGFAMWCYSNGY